MGHEPVVALEVSEDRARLGAGKDDRELGRASNAFYSSDEIKFSIEDLLVEEKQRT